MYNNKKTIEFITNPNIRFILENKEYISRFSLKDIKAFKNIPINKPMPYSQNLLIKAIKYGLIYLISYKGEEDKSFSGHERVIYPLVLGKSTKGKYLLRGWHLQGWSVSNNRYIEKIWRQFRCDRIKSITFTGSFYRLPPKDYNMDDKGMKGGIIARANFNNIRRNQQNLINSKSIRDKDEISLGDDKTNFVTIKVDNTDSELDLLNIEENPYIKEAINKDGVKITFLKSIYGNKYIAILDAIGNPKNTVKVFDENNKNLGVYKILDSTTGEVLKKLKNVKGNTIYDLYIFDKKLSK